MELIFFFTKTTGDAQGPQAGSIIPFDSIIIVHHLFDLLTLMEWHAVDGEIVCSCVNAMLR